MVKNILSFNSNSNSKETRIHQIYREEYIENIEKIYINFSTIVNYILESLQSLFLRNLSCTFSSFKKR